VISSKYDEVYFWNFTRSIGIHVVIFKETNFTIGFAATMFLIQCTTFWSRNNEKFENFEFWGLGEVQFKFWSKLPKGTPLCQN